jgi:DNA polymerase-3 subunit epsilon
MNLNLNRPIIVFDLETTGINVSTDRIIEICYIKIFPNGNEESKVMRLNPEMHISEESSAMTGIYDDDVKDCPTFKDVAPELAKTFEGCDVAGFNSNHFDIPLLVEEFLRLGIDLNFGDKKCVDVQNIYHKLERRTLSAAYKFYCGKDLENAHSAMGDTLATYEVLKAQLDHYPDDLKNDISFLADFSKMNDVVDFAGRMIYNEKHEEIFNFGKYKGMRVVDVLRKDPGYYSWIENGNFTRDTKMALTRIRLREFKK